MSNWWESGYAGGPMVKVKGFPRPLYSPDAASQGKQPSGDGPDVVAYKRTVCRAGRWGDFDPNQWDNSYSNNFAHGKKGTGGDVQWTGVAGVQRQQKISPDSGWLGEQTFNTLRSIKVPEGPHKGEMAMDSYAADLVNQAFDMFGGSEKPATSVGDRILAEMKKLVGKHEQPAGSNHVPGITDWYGADGQPWCAMTCTKAGVGAASKAFLRGSRWAYCPYIYSDAKAGKFNLALTGDPRPGDLVLFDWDWDTVWDHVGCFVKWVQKGSSFQTIEGNIDSECAYHTRYFGSQGLAFVRVKG